MATSVRIPFTLHVEKDSWYFSRLGRKTRPHTTRLLTETDGGTLRSGGKPLPNQLELIGVDWQPKPIATSADTTSSSTTSSEKVP